MTSSSRDRPRVRRLRAGTEAHYRDAAYYDQAYRRRTQDAQLYLEMARRHGSPVLELGVGTARVAALLARHGVSVVGIDRMPQMLQRARQRMQRLPKHARQRIELRRGDLRSLRLQRRFPLVIAPFNVFMHLYDRRDIEKALAVVRRHLRPRGRLVFDVSMPDLKALSRDPGKLYRCRPVTRPDGRRYRYAEAFRYDAIHQVQHVSMAFEQEDDPNHAFVTPLTHRQLFPAELEALLHYNGFRIVDRYGDFERGPLTERSESQIVVARATSRAR